MTSLEYIIKKHRLNLDDESPFLLARKRWDYLPALFQELGYVIGAEIGVEAGRFSKRLCQAIPDLKLYCIDPWLSYGYYTTTKYSAELMEQKYRETLATLAPYNCEILREHSVVAAGEIGDGSLDFVHIDANHGYDYVYQDLQAWTPKVRQGGIISGHDFFNSRVAGRCRVKDAVLQWTAENALHPWFVIVGSRTPSYFWEKP